MIEHPDFKLGDMVDQYHNAWDYKGNKADVGEVGMIKRFFYDGQDNTDKAIVVYFNGKEIIYDVDLLYQFFTPMPEVELL